MKVVWVGFAACIVAGAVQALAETRIGILAGIDEATVHQTDPRAFLRFDWQSVSRFGVGAVVALDWGRRMALRLEPMYAARGSHYLDPSCPCLRLVGYVPQQDDRRLSCLELPALLTVSFGRGWARPYLVGGPAGSHLEKATVRRDGETTDLRRSTRNWDVAGYLGGGPGTGAGRASRSPRA